MEGRLRRYPLHLTIAALIVATLAAYWRVFHNGFVFDDVFYLVQNGSVHKGLGLSSVKWAFTNFYGANWQPLTWLSAMLDYRIYGSNAAGHHLTNLLFHLANTILLLLIFRRMTSRPGSTQAGSLWRSAFVAALFALHPLHVESVAWAAERKDVLSTFFMLLAICAYVKYAERPSLRRYLLVASAFALGLMAKPMLVSLPILLLLLDYWPLRRSLSLPKLVWEKSPLFMLSAASCVITFLAQRSGGAVVQLQRFSVGLRAANSLVSYAAYIGKTFCPIRLAAYYPYPRAGIPAAIVILAVLVMAAISLLVIRMARSRPYLAVGWLWYVVTLIPVIGLVQVGQQAMADRYTYVPLIGIFIMIAWGIPELLRRGDAATRRRGELVFASVGIVVSVALMMCTSRQVAYWHSDYTLFQRAVAVTDGNALALSNYGLALAKMGHYDQAISEYKKAVEADPTYVESYFNLGNAYKQTGRIPEALEQFREALRVRPGYTDTDASVAIGIILAEQGQGDLAAGEYEKALSRNPDDAPAHYNLGLILVKQGKTDEAMTHFERAIEINPDFDKAYYNAAALFGRRGEVDKAAEYYTEALRINPHYAEAHVGLGMIFGMQGRADEAADHFRRAIEIKPNSAEAHNNYGILLAQQGDIDEAMTQFADAIKYSPDFAEAHSNLGRGLAAKGDTDSAIAELEKAIHLNPQYLDAHGNLAMTYYADGRYADAWREVHFMESHGVRLPPDFIKALSSKMPPR